MQIHDKTLNTMLPRNFFRRAVRFRVIGFVVLLLVIVLVFLLRVKSNLTSVSEGEELSADQNYITVSFQGRTGNHMFEYASLLGTARKNNFTPVISEKTYLWAGFKIPMKVGNFYGLNSYKIEKEKRAGEYKEEWEHLPKENIYIQGYLQSFKYFDNVKDELLSKHFVFKDEHINAAQSFLHGVKREQNLENPVFVGVHIRRGDKVRERRKGTGPAPVPYFYRGMNYFTTKYKNVVFVVTSNDVVWCNDNLDSDYYRISYSHEKDGNTDLAVLTQCNHSIISVGSYSWWAGYIAGGEVVYYSVYPDKNTPIGDMYNRQDYYPKSWIPM